MMMMMRGLRPTLGGLRHTPKVLLSSSSVAPSAAVSGNIPNFMGELPSAHNKVSIVRHPVSLDGKPIDDVTKPADRFAVIEFSGTQYKLTVVRFSRRFL
jgi:hypothetical protein